MAFEMDAPKATRPSTFALARASQEPILVCLPARRRSAVIFQQRRLRKPTLRTGAQFLAPSRTSAIGATLRATTAAFLAHHAKRSASGTRSNNPVELIADDASRVDVPLPRGGGLPQTLGRKTMLSRCPILLLALGFSLGCSRDGNMNADERELKEKMKAFLESPEYKESFEDRLALMKKEEAVREEAEWIGKTGLSEELERELPRYLRREFGQSLFDVDSIEAADLTYLGQFLEGGKTVYYWRVPHKQKSVTYFAYIEVSLAGDTVTGWGVKSPPR